MIIRTGAGDKGFSRLSGSGEIEKDSIYFAGLGDIDELRSYISLLSLRSEETMVKTIFETINIHLGSISQQIWNKGKADYSAVNRSFCEYIEENIDFYSGNVNVNGFYNDFNHETAAVMNIARTVSRRVERTIVSLAREYRSLDEGLLVYFNSLSDLLYVLMIFCDKK